MAHSLKGYPRLANLVGLYPGMAIFRRFSRLNAQNLLYMQAELAQMEYELDLVVVEDSQNDNPNVQSFQTCVHNMKKAQGSDSLQWQMVLEMRQRLKEYSMLYAFQKNLYNTVSAFLIDFTDDTLLQHAQLYQLSVPSTYDVRMFCEWLAMPECGDHFLRAHEARIFESPDLVSLHQRARDPFTTWIGERITPSFHHLVGRFFKKTVEGDEENGLVHYEDTTLSGITRVLTILVSSLLPSASIFALYFVESLINRLGVIMGFSVLFSISLAVFTSAQRIEIFAATAAFASVQVVFVGSTS